MSVKQALQTSRDRKRLPHCKQRKLARSEKGLDPSAFTSRTLSQKPRHPKASPQTYSHDPKPHPMHPPSTPAPTAALLGDVAQRVRNTGRSDRGIPRTSPLPLVWTPAPSAHLPNVSNPAPSTHYPVPSAHDKDVSRPAPSANVHVLSAHVPDVSTHSPVPRVHVFGPFH